MIQSGYGSIAMRRKDVFKLFAILYGGANSIKDDPPPSPSIEVWTENNNIVWLSGLSKSSLPFLNSEELIKALLVIIIHKEFVPDSQTIIRFFKAFMGQKSSVQRGYQKQGIWFLSGHKSGIVHEFLLKKVLWCLIIFPKLKLAWKGKRFDTISEVQNASTKASKAILNREYQKLPVL